MKNIIKETGIIIIQFSAYLLKLIDKTEFDTIYHEHFSYFSLLTLQKVFSHHNLTIFDVEEIPIHGGSLRIYVKHKNNKKFKITKNIEHVLKKEKLEKLEKMETYEEFQDRVNRIKNELILFLKNAKKNKKKVIAYGAPAKGNTLLNFCNIKKDLIEFTVDKNPYKQKLFLPGSHIPIKNPEKINKKKHIIYFYVNRIYAIIQVL